jgi:glycine cleavage system regulatory protein
VLAQEHVNIEELETAVAGAPMSGEQLFRARAQLRLPASVTTSVTTDSLRSKLEALAGELMVDVALDEPAP